MAARIDCRFDKSKKQVLSICLVEALQPHIIRRDVGCQTSILTDDSWLYIHQSDRTEIAVMMKWICDACRTTSVCKSHPCDICILDVLNDV